MRTAILSLLFIASLAVAKGHNKVRCGNGLPACTGNRCCSAGGYCGFGKNYCSTGCQSEFGRCRPVKQAYPPLTVQDPSSPLPPPTTTPPAPLPPATPQPPSGTQRPPRPKGLAPAKIIYKCTVPGTVAITFDDGPAMTTHVLLDVLAQYPDVRVTFFINGLNYVDARLPEYQAVIARAYQSGHQIASHTFQHKDLATLSPAEIEQQMLLNDDVIYSAIGRVPRYMRPPYGSTNDVALEVLGDLGYVATNWNLDTRDWATGSAEESTKVYEDMIASGQGDMFIALQHDTVASTATNLMDMVIPLIRQQNLRMVTIAECLGDPNPYL